MSELRIALVSLSALMLAFVLVTLIALEGREVVILHTFDTDGQVRRTRTWVADDGGYTWIEAANLERPFLTQLRTNPEVRLDRGGTVYSCTASVAPNPDGHQHIRRLLAAKYGWADAWIGLLTDTTASVAVRLQCR